MTPQESFEQSTVYVLNGLKARGIEDDLSVRMAMAKLYLDYREYGLDVAASPEVVADALRYSTSDGTIEGDLRAFGWEPPKPKNTTERLFLIGAVLIIFGVILKLFDDFLNGRR